MNVWDQVDAFEEQAQARGDAQRVRLARIHAEAYDHRHSNPDRMLGLVEEGLRLARTLGEAWWVIFFEHWRLETQIYYKDDYRTLLDGAVALTLELRKPVHESHPLRFHIWCNLVAAYLCVDPRGYAGPVQQALDFLQKQMPLEGEEKYLLLARQHWYAFELGRYEESAGCCQRALAFADDEPDRHLALHHMVGNYCGLCRLAQRRQSWPALGEAAATGEELARRRSGRYELALFLIWQALAARMEGREEQARRLSRLGTAQMHRLGKTPDDCYHDALSAFHERGSQLPAALRVRDSQLALLLNKGQLATEADCRIQRCRLLARMGQLPEDEVSATRTAISHLRAPQTYVDSLEHIVAGQTDPDR
jgi:hypothetical protein